MVQVPAGIKQTFSDAGTGTRRIILSDATEDRIVAARTEARIEVRRERHKPKQQDYRLEYQWEAARLRFYISHVDNAT